MASPERRNVTLPSAQTTIQFAALSAGERAGLPAIVPAVATTSSFTWVNVSGSSTSRTQPAPKASVPSTVSTPPVLSAAAGATSHSVTVSGPPATIPTPSIAFTV